MASVPGMAATKEETSTPDPDTVADVYRETADRLTGLSDDASRVDQIIACEQQVESLGWHAVDLIVAERAAGTTQTRLATLIGKSQTHVSLCEQMARNYPGNNERAQTTYAEAYREAKEPKETKDKGDKEPKDPTPDKARRDAARAVDKASEQVRKLADVQQFLSRGGWLDIERGLDDLMTTVTDLRDQAHAAVNGDQAA